MFTLDGNSILFRSQYQYFFLLSRSLFLSSFFRCVSRQKCDKNSQCDSFFEDEKKKKKNSPLSLPHFFSIIFSTFTSSLYKQWRNYFQTENRKNQGKKPPGGNLLSIKTGQRTLLKKRASKKQWREKKRNKKMTKEFGLKKNTKLFIVNSRKDRMKHSKGMWRGKEREEEIKWAFKRFEQFFNYQIFIMCFNWESFYFLAIFNARKEWTAKRCRKTIVSRETRIVRNENSREYRHEKYGMLEIEQRKMSWNRRVKWWEGEREKYKESFLSKSKNLMNRISNVHTFTGYKTLFPNDGNGRGLSSSLPECQISDPRCFQIGSKREKGTERKR